MLNAMRWPIHLNMIPGERLSSWLRRSANPYGLRVQDLLKDVGIPLSSRNRVDLRISGKQIRAIAERTGTSLSAVRATTFAGILPSSLLRVTPSAPSISRPMSVFCEPMTHRRCRPLRRIRWVRREAADWVSACRSCLAGYPDTGIMLFWGLSVVFSCPIHGLLLEPAQIKPKEVVWLRDHSDQAPAVLSMLDRRTYSAVMDGCVRMPGDIISDHHWYRVLQTIFQELGRDPTEHTSSSSDWCQMIWSMAGYAPRPSGERFSFDLRCAMFIATAIEQLENGSISPSGTEGRLFTTKKPALERNKPPELWYDD